eukprot:10501668-Ditylum_brightwellii.AAC.1
MALHDEIQQHHLDKSVVQRRSVCHQGQNLHRLRSSITPLALDENRQHCHQTWRRRGYSGRCNR